ncbi:MAG: N-acetyltransferase family protein [Desulfobacterales bacterium]|nr:N-acetyltransferase family protein [Desulfobacterales bacterium]
MEYIIEKMISDDWHQVRSIYIEGISTEHATFEPDIPEWDAWDANHLPHSRLVALLDGYIVGWAALSRVSNRRVYSGVAEASIYVGATYQGKGVGAALLSALIKDSEENGFWTLQAGIFPENKSSLGLHRQFGFREVGRRERIGKMTYGKLAGKWRDVILMERRSKKNGIDESFG